MVLGMLPTALGRGMGSEFRSPMAVAVIGGVITSTMLTLWVVPVVFVRVERLRGWLRRRRNPPAPPAHPEGQVGPSAAPATEGAPEPEIAA
jgi:antibiotic biosynthesis monooxygenase (ABM) superfamily enzyme